MLELCLEAGLGICRAGTVMHWDFAPAIILGSIPYLQPWEGFLECCREHLVLLWSCSTKLQVPVLKQGWEFPAQQQSLQWQQLQTNTELTPGCGGYTLIELLFKGMFSYHVSIESV